MKNLSPRELNQYLSDTDTPPLLLDVREPWEYQLCRIDNFELIPMRQIPSVLDKLDPEREIVVLCHHGIRSRQVCLYMERAGFNHMINVDGGIAAWQRDVDPTMATY